MPQTACTSDQTEKQIMESLIFSTTHKEAREGRLPLGKCFISPVSNDQMAVISIGFFPTNTKKNTSLAKSCCQEWTSARNRKSAEEDKPQGPENLLENPDIHELNYWIHVLLPKFETKRENLTLTAPPPPTPSEGA